MQEYLKNQEISTYTINFTSKILENIINFHSSLDEIDKPIKKQENCVAFPFSISLESSKSYMSCTLRSPVDVAEPIFDHIACQSKNEAKAIYYENSKKCG